MKTLLQINCTCNWGSTGRIAEQISLLAQKNGWTCYIAHGGRYIRSTVLKSIKISSRIENCFHAFLGETLGLHGLGSYYSTKRFIKRIQIIKPDVIHLHNIHGYYLNYQLLFDYLATVDIPVVWTLHDCWALTGHCTHFEMYGCEKWKKQCENCPLLMAQYKSRFVDRSRRNYILKRRLYSKLKNVTIVPVSNWLADIVSESILRDFPIRVIQNGIDLNVFKPMPNNLREKYSIPFDKMIILSVMNGYDKEKGIDEINKIAEIGEYQVIIVGLPIKCKSELSRKIINVGRTSNQLELAEYYSAADVFINPTYNDTSPTTNMESLACGTPVITYKTGGSPEILSADTGYVVDKGDFEGLIKAIETIKRNGKKSYSQYCCERAKRYFNKNERYMDYIDLYNDIIR